jgi:hypothetical protein
VINYTENEVVYKIFITLAGGKFSMLERIIIYNMIDRWVVNKQAVVDAIAVPFLAQIPPDVITTFWMSQKTISGDLHSPGGPTNIEPANVDLSGGPAYP